MKPNFAAGIVYTCPVWWVNGQCIDCGETRHHDEDCSAVLFEHEADTVFALHHGMTRAESAAIERVKPQNRPSLAYVADEPYDGGPYAAWPVTVHWEAI